MRTGDYLFPKIVVIIMACVPIVAVIGMIIVNTTGSLTDGMPVVALSFIAIISSIITYQAFKKTIEQLEK